MLLKTERHRNISGAASLFMEYRRWCGRAGAQGIFRFNRREALYLCDPDCVTVSRSSHAQLAQAHNYQLSKGCQQSYQTQALLSHVAKPGDSEGIRN